MLQDKNTVKLSRLFLPVYVEMNRDNDLLFLYQKAIESNEPKTDKFVHELIMNSYKKPWFIQVFTSVYKDLKAMDLRVMTAIK